jgi:hypothetical protein
MTLTFCSCLVHVYHLVLVFLTKLRFISTIGRGNLQFLICIN